MIGGGAAGFFAAITAKRKHPHASVLLLEKSAVLLAKVRVSGGGRCNVTHACFDPKQLIKHYPRGEKELLGPFYRFQPQDIIEWFESRGVPLKVEPDGRMFPTTNSSETIIQALIKEAQLLGVAIFLKERVLSITKESTLFKIERKEGGIFQTPHLILATGSAPEGHAWAESFGHQIEKPVPSLFTFNVPDSPLKELSGIVADPVVVQIEGFPLAQRGPLLITHFGFSGPAILKLSAWGARFLHEKNYVAMLVINWAPEYKKHQLCELLVEWKNKHLKKQVISESPFQFPRNLWKVLVAPLSEKKWGELSMKELHSLGEKLHADRYQINGKTTHKEEFVTCGGVCLKEVNFQKMESKISPGLFFAGEILDIDGITGGFNFQNAWTTGFIAGESDV